MSSCPATGPWGIGTLPCTLAAGHPPGHSFAASAGADLSGEVCDE